MTTKIKKWGNSLGVRIPKDIVNSLNISDGSQVNLSVENGKLIISTETSLDSLISKITPQNLHNEVEVSQVLGSEEW